MPTVLITSANRGLGLEFAAQYLTDGWHVYAACRQPKSAEKLQRLAQKEDKIDVFAMDVTNGSSIHRAAKKIGDDAIDVLINSAGITGKSGQKTGHVDYASWAQVLDVNAMGPLRVTEASVDNVARSERKLVVTITSGMGSIADNTSGGSIAYRSSKAAVNMVMRCAAVDLAGSVELLHGIGRGDRLRRTHDGVHPVLGGPRLHSKGTRRSRRKFPIPRIGAAAPAGQ